MVHQDYNPTHNLSCLFIDFKATYFLQNAIVTTSQKQVPFRYEDLPIYSSSQHRQKSCLITPFFHPHLETAFA